MKRQISIVFALLLVGGTLVPITAKADDDDQYQYHHHSHVYWVPSHFIWSHGHRVFWVPGHPVVR